MEHLGIKDHQALGEDLARAGTQDNRENAALPD